MFKDIRSLGKESFIYGFSTIAARFLNFLLLPFYTHYLSPADYGIGAAVFSYIAFFNILYHYGMDQAYMRYFDEKERSFPAAFAGVFWVSLAFTLVLALNASRAAVLAGIGAVNARLVVYAAGILFVDALSAVPFAGLRMEHKALSYSLIRVLSIVINMALNILFIARLGFGLEGIFMANAVSSLFALAAVLYPCRRALSLKTEKEEFKKLLVFALPLVPAGLGSMAVQVIDRPLLLKLADSSAVGIYQANYRLGIFMMLVVGMFDAAWRPFFIERAQKENAREIFARVLTYFVFGGAWLALAVSFFIGDLAKFAVFSKPIIHQAYWGGLSIVPVILWGYFFNGIYINFLAPVIITKNTKAIMNAATWGAGINIIANLALIPEFGITGAAWATFIAYFVMAAELYGAGRKIYAVPYEFRRISAVLAVSLLFSLPLFWPGALQGGAWTLYRFSALAAYPCIFILCGFLFDDEKAALREYLGLAKPPTP
ncbi:MAG: polysaccharide biosynthesis C-terminal domain-containing protein [Elusimicrobia bacterium]|nr:polysaccharide biosynthesis C-terminal domain-containing protein [Elusimicrobiota bacterium]